MRPGHVGADLGCTCLLWPPDDIPPSDNCILCPFIVPRLKPLRCILSTGMCGVDTLDPCMCVDAPDVSLVCGAFGALSPESFVLLDMLPAKLLCCKVGGDSPTRKRLFCCIDEGALPSLGKLVIFGLNDTFFTVFATWLDRLHHVSPTIPCT